MLEVDNLTKSFGELRVLDGISFRIDAGGIHTLMGPNGSGKTTLFNILTGFLKADSGTMWLNDKNLNNLGPPGINEAGIGRTFQDMRLIKQLTVRENVLLAFHGNPGENFFKALLPQSLLKKQLAPFEQKADAILDQIHLTEVKDSKAGEISFGQQKLLALGCCMANDADLLLLDEPVAGINPQYREEIKEILLNLKQQGKGILLIEHHPDFIETISDQLFFLNAGDMLTFDNYQQMKEDDFVKEAYL